LQLFHEAANKGSGVAATYLGDLYYFGIEVSPDKAAGEHWFETGVKLHNPIAAYDLGSLFSTSNDHLHDFPKAARLLRRASGEGYVPAMHSLGVLLIEHPELARSPQEARHLLETAADAGSWKASIVLGVLARDGIGTPVNSAEAFYHFQIAALQGGDQARILLTNDFTRLSSMLGNVQTQELTTKASTWFQKRPVALAFVHVDSGDRKHLPAWGRAIGEDGMPAGRLFPVPSG